METRDCAQVPKCTVLYLKHPEVSETAGMAGRCENRPGENPHSPSMASALEHGPQEF